MEQTEIFSYSYNHKNGDQCWEDYFKYLYCPETNEIKQKFSCGWTMEDKTTIISKDTFLEIVDKVQKNVKDYQKARTNGRDWYGNYYEIFTDLSNNDREIVENYEEMERNDR